MTGQSQPLGRRRESRIDEAIADAVRGLLREAGYAGVTIDAVAGRARIGRAAIYRRFSTKQEMIFAAAVHDMSIAPPADTGSLRGDLVQLTRAIHASMTSPTARAVLPELLADVARDEGLGQHFRETFVATERTYIAAVLDRAVGRGELAAPPDLDLVHTLLTGPVFTWQYFLGKAATPMLADEVAEILASRLLRDDS